jgi:hypothetical protein
MTNLCLLLPELILVHLLDYLYVYLMTISLILGRNKEYLENAVSHTKSVAMTAVTLRFFPDFLKPYTILEFPNLDFL